MATQQRPSGVLIAEDIYQDTKRQFAEMELINLTLAVIAINSHNRINIAFGAPVGAYHAGQFA
ncbi:MAG TPA: hypothetical protein VKR32_06805 [Puia sp.]|nr:hypothetical protein [Puia sp.]